MKLQDFVKDSETFAEFGRDLYDHIGCGPYVIAVLNDGTELYYEDDAAKTVPLSTLIQGIKLGSIIEGWDGDGITPILITDPSTFYEAAIALDQTIDAILEIIEDDDDLIAYDLISTWQETWRGTKAIIN